MALVPWPCPHQGSFWAAAAVSMAPSPQTRMPSPRHSLRRPRCPSISSATFSGTVKCPSAGCCLFLSSGTSATSQKGQVGSWVAKETLPSASVPLFYPVSLFSSGCPYPSSLPLPPPHFPFLVSSSPPPLCLRVLSYSLPLPWPSLLALYLLVSLPQGYHGGSRGGEREILYILPTSSSSGVSPRAQHATLLNAFVHSVPDESSALEDRSMALSPEERDPGLFLLRKDSERRAILYRILWEEQNQVASNLQECVVQVQTEGRHLLTGTAGCPVLWHIHRVVLITGLTSFS